jgi:hypothetical protein
MRANVNFCVASLCSVAVVSACGLPAPPNIRANFVRSIEPLGVQAVYPMQERVRLGQFWVVDNSVNKSTPPRVPSSSLISDGPADDLEAARAQLMSAHRNPETGKSLDNVVGKDQPGMFVPPTGDTLEVVGIPKYTLASIDQESLGIGVPTTLARFFAG